jgi:hypothetical protein
VKLRAGNAGSNTVRDHLEVLTAAINQIPAPYRRDLLITCDGAGATKDLLTHITTLNAAPGRRTHYSVGFDLDERARTAIRAVPTTADDLTHPPAPTPTQEPARGTAPPTRPSAHHHAHTPTTRGEDQQPPTTAASSPSARMIRARCAARRQRADRPTGAVEFCHCAGPPRAEREVREGAAALEPPRPVPLPDDLVGVNARGNGDVLRVAPPGDRGDATDSDGAVYRRVEEVRGPVPDRLAVGHRRRTGGGQDRRGERPRGCVPTGEAAAAHRLGHASTSASGNPPSSRTA